MESVTQHDAPAPEPTPGGSAVPEPDLTGRTLGDFHILRRIGQGEPPLNRVA